VMLGFVPHPNLRAQNLPLSFDINSAQCASPDNPIVALQD
jgi:hypothetical protein